MSPTPQAASTNHHPNDTGATRSLPIVPDYAMMFVFNDGAITQPPHVLELWIDAKCNHLRSMKQRGASQAAILQEVQVLLAWTRHLRRQRSNIA
ncbi:hypothetical protein H257_17695 [Aphanomyces astaci]|uniref:Uncharacterized protein n=1 Tax=Aphanomyces astaci TaxID=112090 RepID=W4FDV3_APHAT|nr:hypothetical protein H257_17695 [Aphanomyces astaci]ETV65645.1 hypothetical protein H257_17695 [Aphanomyces astaci]|eukprot:XP_009844884.1 hypothetical protein H257_17695 [Aphanomyces astaci]